MATDSSRIHDVRAAYEASAYGMAVRASRAYVRALTEHQDAALSGDLDALRNIVEARTLFALTAPELTERQHADPAIRREFARRSIA